MKISTLAGLSLDSIDAVASKEDNVEVEVRLTPYKLKQILLVTVNGETILRIRNISLDKEVLITRNI